MTDEARAVKIAKHILKIQQSFDPYPVQIGELAQAFLALSEKCEKMQAVIEAAKVFVEGSYHGVALGCDCVNCKHRLMTLADALSKLEQP